MNINATVRVTLTDAGAKVFMGQDDFYPHLPMNNVLECKLWQLMRLFGRRMHAGAVPCFVDNEIQVVDK